MTERALWVPVVLTLGVVMMWWAQLPDAGLANLWSARTGEADEDAAMSETEPADGIAWPPVAPADAEAAVELPPAVLDTLAAERDDRTPGQEASDPLVAAPEHLMDAARADGLPRGTLYPKKNGSAVELWVWAGEEHLAGIDLWLQWDPEKNQLEGSNLRYTSIGAAGAHLETDPKTGLERLWLSHRLPDGLDTRHKFVNLGSLRFSHSRSTGGWLWFEPCSVDGKQIRPRAERLQVTYRGLSL